MPDSLIILGLLPNPTGRDRGRECVLLRNASPHPITLGGYLLVDERGRQTALAGSCAPWEERAWVLDGKGAALINNGGRLELRSPAGTVHAVNYGPAPEARWILVEHPGSPSPGTGWCPDLLPESAPNGIPEPQGDYFNLRDYLAALRALRWEPGDVLTVGFIFQEAHEQVRRRVEEAAQEWCLYSNISFQFIGEIPPGPPDPAHPPPKIRVGFLPGPVYSRIGRDCESVPPEQRTMNLGSMSTVTPWRELRRTVLHEFGHALGMIHEHQQPQVPFEWDEAEVLAVFGAPPFEWSEERIRRNILDRFQVDTTQFSAFDPQSIMLYPIPSSVTGGTFHTDWNDVLSPIDKAFVEKLYPAEGEAPVPLLPDGSPQELRFERVGQIYNFVLEILARGRYAVQTEGNLDTVLDIRPAGSAEVLQENDDSLLAQGSNARIELDLDPGTYLVNAWVYFPAATGDATIFASRL